MEIIDAFFLASYLPPTTTTMAIALLLPHQTPTRSLSRSLAFSSSPSLTTPSHRSSTPLHSALSDGGAGAGAKLTLRTNGPVSPMKLRKSQL